MRKTIFFVIIIFSLLLILSKLILNYTNNLNEKKNYGLIIAHRGASGLAPENTITAIRKAIELNSDMVEIDVHQTKDSVIIVIHDESIDRTTEGSGKIKDLYFSQIRKYSAGSWFGEKYANEKIPTLMEVISLVRGQTKLLIEVKGNEKIYPNIVKHIYDLIKKYHAKNWCIIQSFNDEILNKFYQLDSTLTLQKLIVADIPGIPLFVDNFINIGNLKDYKFIEAININSHFVHHNILKELHNYGFKVNVWVVNDSTEIEGFFKMGVDGVITNFPNYKRGKIYYESSLKTRISKMIKN